MDVLTTWPQAHFLRSHPPTNSILTLHFVIPILMSSPHILCLQFLFFAHADTPAWHAFFCPPPPFSAKQTHSQMSSFWNFYWLLLAVSHSLFCSPATFCPYPYFTHSTLHCEAVHIYLPLLIYREILKKKDCLLSSFLSFQYPALKAFAGILTDTERIITIKISVAKSFLYIQGNQRQKGFSTSPCLF